MASKSSKVEIRDKHLQLDQIKLDEARHILGTQTERETVERALDLIISEKELDRVLKQLKRQGTIKKIFR